MTTTALMFFLIIQVGQGLTTIPFPYKTQAACESAANLVRAKIDNLNYQKTAICVPAGGGQ